MKAIVAPILQRRVKKTSTGRRGFTLILTISLLMLLTIIGIGILNLSAIELRRSSQSESRSIAFNNARLGLMMALNRLQTDAGDDRRITADADIFKTTSNPNATGIWSSWTPALGTRSRAGAVSVNYALPKAQTGFKSWLVSSADPLATRDISWHTTNSGTNQAKLFTTTSSGFELDAEKVNIAQSNRVGAFAWAVTQENTKARINIGTDDTKRISLDDQMQTPSRPNLSLSTQIQQPANNWSGRAAAVISNSQSALDPAYGLNANSGNISKNFTTQAYSLLTNSVAGGLKVDLTTGFDLTDEEFEATAWNGVTNPFRSTSPREYKGQKPLFKPLNNSSKVTVFMDFAPASVNHKFNVNGVPTFDTLRAYYRQYRHLFNSSQGGTTAFERPYSHVSSDKVTGRPFGVKSQPGVAPVLDRVNFIFSVIAKADGTLGILISPIVTIWNPHNVDIETEGLVVYPWIDLAVFWNWNVSAASGSSPGGWNSSLSRLVGEGYDGHGRSSRPFFYLHLTQNGTAVSRGTKTISPAIHLAPGEVRTFVMADNNRRDLEIQGTPEARTWRMKPVNSASDISNSTKTGIVLDMTKTIGGTSNFNYKLKPGDTVNSARVEFDRSQYYYIVNMADSYQIKNPSIELMADNRSALGSFPALPEEKNLYYYAQVHSHRASGKGNDGFSYPSFRFEEIRDNPKMVGSLMTYHRVAQSSTLPLSDLMFTVNPRQPFINQYLSGADASGARFQTAPHYESLLQGGTSLVQLAMETTSNGQKAFYGPSHSAATGRTNLAFFEIPRSPTLSLGAFQHCDISSSAFGSASQIGNSWASPYMVAQSVVKSSPTAPNGESLSPALSVYDSSYLANDALFDDFFLSGAAPEFDNRSSNSGSPNVWNQDQISETAKSKDVLNEFFNDPVAKPLRNPRMTPYRGAYDSAGLQTRFDGPERCVRLAGHLLVEGGFNINSTSEEAWTAVLASLRGAKPASSNKTALSRFRHILTGAPSNMVENDPWSGFRTLTDAEVKLLAKNVVVEVKLRGPFLSLSEFVNRRVASDRSMSLAGALQSAIDKSNLNRKFTYSTFDTANYPNKENFLNANTGTNTPGWLSQADVLQGLAPFISPRSDTFIIRSLGEARDASGNVVASVMLEATVQRVPEWIDPSDDPATAVASLKSEANKNFGRKFTIVSLRRLIVDKSGNPV